MSAISEPQSLYELDRRHVLHPTSPLHDHHAHGPSVVMERGEGIYLTDTNGKRYIDGLSSLWNVNVGHGRTEIAEAAAEQMGKLAFSHTFNRFSHEPVVRLAVKLASLLPGDLNAVQLTSGGSESNDTAFKLIRHYFKLKGEPNRYKIIARSRAYHGITMGATSATGIPSFLAMGGPLAEGFLHAEAPYGYRCGCQGECDGSCSIDSMRGIIAREGADTVAAIIVEPVQGAGGVIVPPPGYLRRVRELCDEYGLLMVADEVITGFGRTGEWFGVMHDGVVPDVLTFAKGVTSGYAPLGGVAVRDVLRDRLAELSPEGYVLPHGFTYSGHPMACAVALKNIEIIEREGLVGQSARMGKLLRERLEAIKARSPLVGNVMSQGLLASIELVQDKETKASFDPSVKAAARLFGIAMERGLITRAIMINGTDIVGLCPPLISNADQIGEICDILEASLNDLERQLNAG